MQDKLTGAYRVRVFRPAFSEVRKLCGSTRLCIEVRRHALKLRYWPENHPESESGQILDLDWEWIRSLRRKRVGELRVHDTINGNDNLRILFFVGDRREGEMPVIWILSVIQKKRDYFTQAQIDVFEGRRVLVIERFYRTPL